MTPFSTGRRADEFARLLDGGQAPVLVGRLRAVGVVAAPAPRPEFRAALRQRLMAVAAVQAAHAPAAPVRPLEQAVSWATARRAGRGAGVAAGALASVVAVSGVAVAGSQSLPGDPFYGVKRTTEAFQLRTADGDVGKGTLHLELASTRLREVRGLTLGRDAALVPVSAEQPLAEGAALGPAVAARVRETLADMDADTRRGTALLTRAFRSSRETAPLEALSRFATRQTDGLEQLLPALPAATRDRARVSLALLTGVTTDAEELLGLGTCGPACDPATTAPLSGGVPSSGPLVQGSPPPCGCEPAPVPAPQASATAEPSAPAQETSAAPQSEPTATSQPSPRPSASPAPSSSSYPLPVPLPVPVPPLPVPLPELPLPSLPPVPLPEPLASLLPTFAPVPAVDPLLPGARPSPSPVPGLPLP